MILPMKEMVTEKISIFNVGFNLFLNSYYVVSSVNMNNFLEKKLALNQKPTFVIFICRNRVAT